MRAPAVAAGQVEIYIGDEKVHELVQNQSFAEDAMLTVIDESVYTAEAALYCELWYLSRTIFCELLEDFPSVREKLPEMRKRIRQFKSKGADGIMRASAMHDAAADRADEHGRYIHPETWYYKVWNIVVLAFIVYNKGEKMPASSYNDVSLSSDCL